MDPATGEFGTISNLSGECRHSDQRLVSRAASEEPICACYQKPRGERCRILARRIIFSDLHFGDPGCSLSRQANTTGLRALLRSPGPADYLVPGGDILDANKSSLTRAIEMYLHYFRKRHPDVFILGHTHKAGHTNTEVLGTGKARRLIAKDIDVWNDGCFLSPRSAKQGGAFIVTNDDPVAVEGDRSNFWQWIPGGVSERRTFECYDPLAGGA